MKKILCLLSVICISIFNFGMYAENYPQSVDLRKAAPSGPPRAPALNPVSFQGEIYMGELTITAQNYEGDIEVIITGSSTIDETVQIDSSGSVTLDISALPPGDYTISVITVGKGTFVGDFTITDPE